KHDQPFKAMTRYNVRVLAPKNENDGSGIRAFDGVPLAKEFSFAFTTGDAMATANEPKRTVDYCKAVNIGCIPPMSPGCRATKAGGGFRGTRYRDETGAGDQTCHSGSTPLRSGRTGQVLLIDDALDGEKPARVARSIAGIAKARTVAPESALDP